MDKRMWNPFKMLRTRIDSSSKAQDLLGGLTFSRALVAGAAGLDPALCIAVPVGHELEEVRQLVGSNEGASRKNRRRAEEGKTLARTDERKNAREGTCLAPSRGMREREHERTRAGKRSKRRGN